eukprot:TRINITY_DN2178_c0_g1_i1.p1 TRINITY_DN2178_c0_g1~~TRINITY_DN2178_c0_g1_i1.p1  ORF type:complete len:846 (+),score=204.33 TRINITY_DN2178_c0_g1_i1:283-2538(+)
MKAGQFVLKDAQELFIGDGKLDPDGIAKVLINEEEIALGEGYTALRITSDTSWLYRMADDKTVSKCETQISMGIQNHKIIFFCQFDEHSCSHNIIMDCLTFHPLTIIESKLMTNFYYVPPDGHLRDKRDEIMVDNWIKNIKSNHQLNLRLRDAIKSKNRFFANLNHELRTPAMGLLGSVELLNDTSLSEEQRSMVETIKNCAEHLSGLWNDLLDITKMNEDMIVLDEIPFNLQECIESAIEIFSSAAAKKNLSITNIFSPGVPMHVMGDPLRLRQIFCNLISNAIKFTATGGILIEIRSTRSLDNSNDECEHIFECRVTDTGIGVPPTAQHIFDSFTQVDDSTTRKFGGTGLGLAICKRLVCMMGGDIKVESDYCESTDTVCPSSSRESSCVPGPGASFIFTILLKESGERESLEREDNQFSGKTLLIVDSSKRYVNQVESQIKRWGIHAKVEEAFSPEILQGSVDFILLDEITLSGCLKESVLLAKSKFPEARIIVMAYPKRGVNFKSVEGLIDSVVYKPIRSKHLFTAISGGHCFLSGLSIVGTSSAATFPHTTSNDSDYVQNMAASTSRPRIAQYKYPESPRGKKRKASQEVYGRNNSLELIRVLVVEDNYLNRKILTKMLEAIGVIVESACDGQEAIDACIQKQFDIVFMDVHMSNVDGLEATSRILAHSISSGKSAPPIIGMSADNSVETQRACMESGMTSTLNKPTSKMLLEATILRHTEKVLEDVQAVVYPPSKIAKLGTCADD